MLKLQASQTYGLSHNISRYFYPLILLAPVAILKRQQLPLKQHLSSQLPMSPLMYSAIGSLMMVNFY